MPIRVKVVMSAFLLDWLFLPRPCWYCILFTHLQTFWERRTALQRRHRTSGWSTWWPWWPFTSSHGDAAMIPSSTSSPGSVAVMARWCCWWSLKSWILLGGMLFGYQIKLLELLGWEKMEYGEYGCIVSDSRPLSSSIPRCQITYIEMIHCTYCSIWIIWIIVGSHMANC